MRRAVTGDEVLVRAAGRRVAWQISAMVASVMLALIAMVTVIVVRQQQAETDRVLRASAATADDVNDPPAGAWIVLERPRVVDDDNDQTGRCRGSTCVETTPGLPAQLVVDLARARQRTPVGAIRLATLRLDDSPTFRLLTHRADATRSVQVVMDLAPQHRERAQLFQAMGVAAASSLLASAGIGLLLGRRAVRPLAQALGLQRTFVADASHELRTPLTLLSTRAQLLHRALVGGGAPAQALADAEGVVQDVQRLGEVVEDLLVAAAPGGHEERNPLDVGDLLEDVVASANAHADRSQVSLSLSSLPGVTVRGSRVALRRAVLALVDNAIDHTPPGGEVRVGLRVERRDVVVSVSDTGPGIAPEQQAEVLTRFHSGGQRAGRAHYGLGLALTHDIANRHGGQLRLAPSAAGATFELLLPLELGIPRKS